MKTLLTIMAIQYLGTVYRWGGNNYDGLDCSGFVLKALSDAGYTLPDMTSQGLYDHCKKHGLGSSKECDAILFFGKSTTEITHTAISLGEIDGKWLMIEAGGAGKNSLTMTREELAQRDARVRIRPVTNRKDLIASMMIPYRRD